MKRLLPFIPIAFLFFLNSCDGVPISPNMVGTFMAQTQISQTQTAEPTPTYNPHIPEMENGLNYDLSTINPLERSMDAQYHVIKVWFPHVANSSALTFRVDVGCLCIKSTECCIPERTFVVLMEAMKRNRGLIQVPSNVSEIMVVCSNYQNGSRIGAISASWTDAYDFLLGHINGEQLGAYTTRTVVP